jgi:hypothetical protein
MVPRPTGMPLQDPHTCMHAPAAPAAGLRCSASSQQGPWQCPPAAGLHTDTRSPGRSSSPSRMSHLRRSSVLGSAPGPTHDTTSCASAGSTAAATASYCAHKSWSCTAHPLKAAHDMPGALVLTRARHVTAAAIRNVHVHTHTPATHFPFLYTLSASLGVVRRRSSVRLRTRWLTTVHSKATSMKSVNSE